MGYAHFDEPMKIGVKLVSNLRKMTISRVENACKPLILLGLQKNIKKISTHLLTVLTNKCYSIIAVRTGINVL